MGFQIGDFVAVIDEKIKGVVVSVEGVRVLIREENGFDLYFEASQLVKIEHDQSKLSKFLDINNVLFQQKKQDFSAGVKKTQKKSKKKPNLPYMEVDLHIHQLVKSTKGMSNYDILSLQVDRAKYKLEFALRKRIPKLVFIHGVGEGVLQKELTYLFANYPVKVSPASFEKYGLGATEVYFIQHKQS